jgi:hypothetical protein
MPPVVIPERGKLGKKRRCYSAHTYFKNLKSFNGANLSRLSFKRQQHDLMEKGWYSKNLLEIKWYC